MQECARAHVIHIHKEHGRCGVTAVAAAAADSFRTMDTYIVYKELFISSEESCAEQ